MPYQGPAETDFASWELDVVDRECAMCRRKMYICDHRYRRLHTLEGPVELVCKLNHCPERNCSGHSRTKSPELEAAIAPPRWAIGWDVFCWLGQRRFSRHRSIAQIQTDLRDDYGIELSEDALTKYARRYQHLLAARQQDPELLRRHYESVDRLVLSIDGLQPEKGHETLYVVRELTGKRVWFGEPLLSATADEVRRLIAKAKEWAVLKKQRQSPENTATADPPVDVRPPDGPMPPVADAAENPGAPGRDYCAAVRGILNDDQGGPLHPPGLRMADALTEVRDSIPRNLDAKKGGSPSRNSTA